MALNVTIEQVLAEAHRALGEALVRERLLTAHIADLESRLAAKDEAKAPA